MEIDRSKKAVLLDGLAEEAEQVMNQHVIEGSPPAGHYYFLGTLELDTDGPFEGFFTWQWTADDAPNSLSKADRLAKVVYTRHLESVADYDTDEKIGAPIDIFLVLFECIRKSLKLGKIYFEGRFSGTTKVFVA